MRLFGALKRRLQGWAAVFWRRQSLTPEDLLALRPRRILLVRQHNQMGDMVCATPVFRAIKETWPGAELALVTAPVNRQVVEGNPHLACLFLFEQSLWRGFCRRPVELMAFLRAMRRYDAELAVVLNSVSFSATSAFLALWSAARWVIGGDSAPFDSAVARAYSLRLPIDPTLDRHAVDHSLAPLEAVGITTADRSTVVVPSAADRRLAADIVGRLLPAGPFWALHPGAGKAQNCWPAERFAELARRAVHAGFPVLVLHGPVDRDAMARFLAALGTISTPSPVAAAPPVSVATAAALLELCDRFLCNDTGIMHVAGALKVPTLALFGATDPALWKPLTAAVAHLRAASRAPDATGEKFGWLERLDCDAVWEAWCELPGRSVEGWREALPPGGDRASSQRSHKE